MYRNLHMCCSNVTRSLYNTQYFINKELQKIFDMQIAKFDLFEHCFTMILLSLLENTLEFYDTILNDLYHVYSSYEKDFT